MTTPLPSPSELESPTVKTDNITDSLQAENTATTDVFTTSSFVITNNNGSVRYTNTSRLAENESELLDMNGSSKLEDVAIPANATDINDSSASKQQLNNSTEPVSSDAVPLKTIEEQQSKKERRHQSGSKRRR